ncbi:MAG: OB-fold nucleic acid binding domain-containing protein, partial [Bacteroidota bacterium]
MRRTEIATVLKEPKIGKKVSVSGWVRAFRSNRFIALYDGSSFNTLQVVVPDEFSNAEILKLINFHACIKATGTLVESKGAGQSVEIIADEIEILGVADPEKYSLQPKRMTMEFLREKAHFRMRTSTFAAVFRIRHGIAYAVHKFYNDRGYYYMHTPIITGS